MASSRQMRRSGLSSPQPTTRSDRVATRQDDRLAQEKTGASAGDWEEPALRLPVPSFEDYRGLERHGVLEHMAPLGSLPGSKVRARMKQHEPPARRGLSLRHGDAKAVKEEMSTPEPTLPRSRRRRVSRAEDHQQNGSSSQEPRGENGVRTRASSAVTPTPASPSHSHSLSSPSTRAPEAQILWQKIVDSAVQRANKLGESYLGVAIQKLHDESLHDPRLASLLDNVLSKRQTPEQSAEFQLRLKHARRQLKKSRHREGTATPTALGSPPRSVQNGMHRPSTAQRLARTPEYEPHFPKSIGKSPKSAPKALLANGSKEKEERPTKRMKRSQSTTSDSTLTSVGSELEDYIPRLNGALPIPLPSHQSHHTVTSNKHDDEDISPETLQQAEAVQDLKAEAMDKARKRLPNYETYATSYTNTRSAQEDSQAVTATQPKRQNPPRRNGLASRARQDEESMSDSPLSSQEESPKPPSISIRDITPINPECTAKEGRRGPRIKQSPLKKRNGVSAGIAPALEPDIANLNSGRNDDSSSEHAETCSACGGNGTLLLCEECPRSYHLTCCDPPLDSKLELPEEWRCWHCSASTAIENQTSRETSVWTKLHDVMRHKNPVSFCLPKKIRDFFDGVITTEEGEYEELPNFKLIKARTGYEEQPDNFRIRDRKDKTVLCFRCGGSSLGKHEIIACDYCTLHWHLDCLDPPLASAPNKKTNMAKPRQTWMCPNHIERDLLELRKTDPATGKNMIRHSMAKEAEARGGKRVFKVRKAKKAKVIDIGLQRGFRTNGMIEIMEEISDDDDEMEIEKEINGVIFRVPERGIKLDFIDRIKQSRIRASRTLSDAPSAYSATPSLRANSPSDLTADFHSKARPDGRTEIEKRPFRERKAAINLTQIAQADRLLSQEKVLNLIDTLTAEAPIEVETMVTSTEQADAMSHQAIGDQERRDLLILISLAQRRLDMPIT